MFLPLIRNFPTNVDLFDALLGDSDTLSSSVPRLDVKEDESKYTVFVDLPGVRKENINIDLKDSVLELSTTKEKEEGTNSYLIKERPTSLSRRKIYLGKEVDSNSISAKLDSGILTIEISKAKPSCKKVIIQ